MVSLGCESDLISFCRLERESTGLRERLLDLAGMLDKVKLTDYMEKNRVCSMLGSFHTTFLFLDPGAWTGG